MAQENQNETGTPGAIQPGQMVHTPTQTERGIVAEMVEELTRARTTLREQLAGIENQLYVLKRLGDRMDAAKAAAESAPKWEPPTMTKADPLSVMGLATEDSTPMEPAEGDAVIMDGDDEPPEWADPAGSSAFGPDLLVPDPLHPGELITQEEADRITQGD